MDTKIRVLIADDHAMVRDALLLLINRQADMQVVAQAATGSEAVKLAQAEHPDVAVLDISMPNGSATTAAEAIRAACPTVRVLALTRQTDRAYVRRLKKAGAAGYVLKKSGAETLINAIRLVSQGATYIDPLVTEADRSDSMRPELGSKPDPLTPREQQVLREVAWGRSAKEIAAMLAISTKTVESYKASALEKLSLRSRSDIVRYAVAHGWLSDEVAPDR